MKLTDDERISTICLAVLTDYRIVTDRRISCDDIYFAERYT